MRISVVGLGYVGSVTGSALASMGHEVIGVDIDESKVAVLNEGGCPIPEPGLADLIAETTGSGRLSATTSIADGASNADLVIVSVGTPTIATGSEHDLSAVRRVVGELAELLPARAEPLLIAISSTVPPGTTEQVVRPVLETADGGRGLFRLSFIPEFLREGSAIDDFRNPTRFVIGANATAEGEPFRALRADIPDRHHIVSTEVAELQKCAENCWHATKVTFTNEISRIAQANGVDPHAVMELLVSDDKQNISRAYMRPGFAFGGSCLPKDLRAMVQLARSSGVGVPMLDGLSASNAEHVRAAVDAVARLGQPRVGVLGLAFKAGTDDLRESPTIDLVEALVGQGFDVSIHDFVAYKHPLFGANLKTWDRHSHLKERMVESPEELIEKSDVVVIAQFNRLYLEVLSELPDDLEVVDLAGLTAAPASAAAPPEAD